MAETFTQSEIATYYAARVPKLKQTKAREWRGPCPIHNGDDDNFGVNSETGQWHCHSRCGRGGDILDLEQEMAGVDFKAACGLVGMVIGRTLSKESHREDIKPLGPMIARYEYRDETGKVRFAVQRHEPKDFRIVRPNGRGGWSFGIGDMPRLPYRLPEWKDKPFVCVVEGEKDADNLWKLGVPATTNPQGSGNFQDELVPYFAGKKVAILPDNDEAGDKHAEVVKQKLVGTVQEIRIVRLPLSNAKEDVSDWIRRGGTKDALYALIAQASPIDQRREEDRWTRTLRADIEARGGLDGFWDLKHSGLATPFERMTRAMRGGLRRGEYYVIGGYTGSGKTSIAIQFGMHAILNGHRTAVFSMEMTSEDVFQRMIAISASVDLVHFEFLQNLRIRSAEQKQELHDITARLAEHTTKFVDSPLTVDTRSAITPGQLVKECVRLRQRYGDLDLIIVDHMQLMGSDEENDSNYQRMSQISRALKQAAKEADVPILVLSQVTKPKEGKMGGLDRYSLRDSGTIAEDAAGVILLFHDQGDLVQAAKEVSPYRTDSSRATLGPVEATLFLDKNRFGVGSLYLSLMHEKCFTRFVTEEEYQASRVPANPAPVQDDFDYQQEVF